VLSAGSAVSTTINSAGVQNVSSGGSASGTMINSGGNEVVSAGGLDYNAAVNSSGTQTVYGTASGTTISGASAMQNVSSGGRADKAAVCNEGTQNVYGGGTVSGTTVSSGGNEVVSAGGVDYHATVNSSGTQTVYGTVSGAVISGANAVQTVSSGGSAVSTTINSSGTQQVYSGGTATGTTVNSGGILSISSSGSATGTTLKAGYVLEADTGATLKASTGLVSISNGQAKNVTLNSGGDLTVLTGNRASSTILNRGGVLDISSGGSAVSTTINSSGTQQVYSGGSATGTTVNSGGILSISSGGSATGTTLKAGYVLEADTGATLKASTGSVSISNGQAKNVTLNSGGDLTVLTGNSASSTTLNRDGVLGISSGGSAVSTTINNGGSELVYNGGGASGTTIKSGGSELVYSGGNAASTTVNSGGTQTVYSGAVVTGTSAVSGGVIRMYSGAKLAGVTSIASSTIILSGTSEPFTIDDLTVPGGGMVSLANGTAVGGKLYLGQLSGGADFVINTDLANNKADEILITSATDSQDTVQVNYDPVFTTGKTTSGTAIFATVASGSVAFTPQATEYGAHSYTPVITDDVTGSGETWSITGFTITGASTTTRVATVINGENMVLARRENNDLMKRMGELRDCNGQAGAWTRVYRGTIDTTDVDGLDATSEYSAVQGGYDEEHTNGDGTLYSGYAAGYLSAQSSLPRGIGNHSDFSFGLYRSWLGNKGHFVDIIAKAGRLQNSYTDYLNNGSNTEVRGNYNNWATSISVEYGYRQKLANNWYLEPQAEINLDYNSSASYRTSDNTEVFNRAMNSVVGRLGLAIGRNDGRNSFFLQASVNREFNAVSYTTLSGVGETPLTMGQILQGNWLEMALGLTSKLGNGSNSYLEISKTTGNQTRTPWLVNVGIRWNF